MSEKPINHKLFSSGCFGTIKGSGKDVNEDFAIFYEKEPEGSVGAGNLYVVADGVSGTVRPEVSATFIGKKVLFDYFRSREYAEANKIAIAIRNANHELYHYAQAQHQDMQSVVAAVSVVEGRAVIGTIGNCSVFILRAGVAYKMTEEAAPDANDSEPPVTTLGDSDEIIVDILDAIELKAGDVMIICSDGMVEYAGKREFIEAALAETPKEICGRLLDDLRERGTSVDVTAMVVKIYDENTILSVVRQAGTTPQPVEVAQVAQDIKYTRTAQAAAAASTEEKEQRQGKGTKFRILSAVLAAMMLLGLIYFIGDSRLGWKIFAPRETATPTIDAVQATLSSIHATNEAERIIQLSWTPTATLVPSDTPTMTPVPPTETPAITDTPVATPIPLDQLTEKLATRTSEKDGAEMVYVPEGVFLLGSEDGATNADGDEMPQITVSLAGFWIDKTEVTNKQYLQCVREGACNTNGQLILENPQYEMHPVMSVTIEEAQAYCAWAGRRLPTEFEWEKAARGTDGRIYPWGDEDPTASNNLANTYANETVEGKQADPFGLYEVGSFPDGASPYGVLDMAGNVWEWTSSRYQLDTYVRLSQLADADGVVINPEELAEGDGYVKRGGSASEGNTAFLRSTQRWGDAVYRNSFLGFRCAMSDD